MKTNVFGQATDCHFFRQWKRRTDCIALKDFYNANDTFNQCRGCPFFKTDKEFKDGWNNRDKKKMV